ncbi:MAG TPA: nuclear transport factor 2 family protein [Thermoanaerobaculia bacterium]|nr:nuclear transport factor 2 family protein [Thermoanaerobaculia bacterium]
MKTVTALALLLLTLPLFAADAPANDDAAIRAVIEQYFKSHATGDGQYVNSVFHPELKMMFVRDGAFVMRTRDEYVSGFNGKAPEDEAKRKRSILTIDITGNAAMAKLRLDYPRATLTDYFSLLKINGEWKVVNKIFNSEAKPSESK